VPEYLKIDFSKMIIEHGLVQDSRTFGLKCEAGLYGRSPDRSARVCVRTGIFKMRNT